MASCNVTVGCNDINCGLCERTLHLGCAGVSHEQFFFYIKSKIFDNTYTISAISRGHLFLQFNNGFASMEAELNASLEKEIHSTPQRSQLEQRRYRLIPNHRQERRVIDLAWLPPAMRGARRNRYPETPRATEWRTCRQ
uniref:Uncharacterized protein n=1 Tax=Glossina palpalis gambiensis TaxID=67801 RepID=A0A1B0BYS6_9MUSC